MPYKFLSTVTHRWSRRGSLNLDGLSTPEAKPRREGKLTPETCSPQSIGTVDVQESNSADSNDFGNNDTKVEAMLALRDVIVKQRERLDDYKARERINRQRIHRLTRSLQDQEMASVPTVDRNRIVSFGPSFERSDDLGNLTDLDDPTFSEGIMKAVSSIQERASQVEVAIALDELDSVKSDHKHLKHALEQKELELRALQEKLKQTEEHVATLQLERELAQAEADKYKDDLHACLYHIADHQRFVKDQERQQTLGHRSISQRLFSMLSQRSTASQSSILTDVEHITEFSVPPGIALLCLAHNATQPVTEKEGNNSAGSRKRNS